MRAPTALPVLGTLLCQCFMLLLNYVRVDAQLSEGTHAPVFEQHQQRLEVLDSDARIYLYHHFLSDEECDKLRDMARPRLTRSGVVDTASGGVKYDNIRTSSGMFFRRGQDEFIESIERRLSEWTLMPLHTGEGLQVLRYEKDQQYRPHWDYFFDDKHSRNGENRYATVLMYLEAAEEGGETVFPKIKAPSGINNNFSECARYNLAVKPKKGDAILFHSMKPTGELEERSMHGACPVIKGEKWSMTKWIHASHYAAGDMYDRRINTILSKQQAMLKEHPGLPEDYYNVTEAEDEAEL